MDKAISILSGGLDSAVSTHIASRYHELALAITFDYGQKAASREIESAKNICRLLKTEHKVISLQFFQEICKNSLVAKSAKIPKITIEELEKDPLAAAASAEQVWVPNRNGVFINVAAAIAEAMGFQWIITGFNREEAETFPDNSARFIELTNRCLAESTLAHPQVISYVKEMNKIDILKTAEQNGIEIEKLWCCYDGGDRWCGQCESCTRIMRAMQKLEVAEKYKKCYQVIPA